MGAEIGENAIASFVRIPPVLHLCVNDLGTHLTKLFQYEGRCTRSRPADVPRYALYCLASFRGAYGRWI